MRKLPDSFTGDARHFILPLNVLEVFIRSDIWFSVGVIVADGIPGSSRGDFQNRTGRVSTSLVVVR